AYRNTHTGDLWVALGEVSDQPIPAMMDGWIFHPGYPLIHAQVTDGHLHLEQQRFRYLPSPPNGDRENTQTGQVPVQVRIHAGGNSQIQRLMLTARATSLQLPPDFESVLVNDGGHGFYRVRYDSKLLDRLLCRLPHGLAPIDRFNLVNDAWAAV